MNVNCANSNILPSQHFFNAFILIYFAGHNFLYYSQTHGIGRENESIALHCNRPYGVCYWRSGKCKVELPGLTLSLKPKTFLNILIFYTRK